MELGILGSGKRNDKARIKDLVEQLKLAQEKIEAYEERQRSIVADTNWWKDMCTRLGEDNNRLRQLHQDMLTQVSKERGVAHLREYTERLQEAIEQSAIPVSEFMVALALAGRNVQGVVPHGIKGPEPVRLDFIDVKED